jgi:8-oxo-dGTP diphosphatase
MVGAALPLHSRAETTYNRANNRPSPTSANERFVHRETEMPREIAPTVIVDDLGRLLLQQRDDIPGILYPGAIGLFGGHREGEETFLACAVREIHEELGFYVPPERFDFLTRFQGADPETPGGTLHAEFFIIRGLRASDLTITEGQLLVVQPKQLNAIRQKLTLAARLALDVFCRG